MTPRVGWVPFVDDRRVASVRLRSIRPIEYLRRAGVNAQAFRGDGQYDVVVFQKAYSPGDLALARSLRARGVRIILDACDNHLYNPSAIPALEERAQRLREMMRLADIVTVATTALADFFDHPRVVVVDDALEIPAPVTGVATRLATSVAARRRQILWFGAAGSYDLPFGMRDLGRALRDHPDVLPCNSRLVVCSNARDVFEREVAATGVVASYRTWRRRTFSFVARRADVALLPISVNPYTVGKTSNRIATALLHGLPVVTDRLPSYAPFDPYVIYGTYREGLEAYLADRELARMHVAGGSVVARELYAPERITWQWRRAIIDALGTRSSC